MVCLGSTEVNGTRLRRALHGAEDPGPGGAASDGQAEIRALRCRSNLIHPEGLPHFQQWQFLLGSQQYIVIWRGKSRHLLTLVALESSCVR